jgi:3-keto-5-aminohexanoate cleavage enzyme
MGSSGRSYVYSNSPQLIEGFARGAIERHLGIEFECFDAGQIENVRSLIHTGVLPADYPLNFDLVLGIGGGAPATPKMLSYMVDALPKDTHWTAMAISQHQAPITTMAMILGGGVRVGFEDNVYLYKGVLATSNAQFVDRTVRIAREIGREVASVDDARQILGLRRAGARAGAAA